MSKSLGNGINPDDIVKKYGAEILRLWVASSDYHADIRISPEILKQLSEGYRKIRNTARFILGCIGDFDPDKDMVPDEKLESIDKWAIMKLNGLIKDVTDGYESYEYHNVYHAVHNFCIVDMSNFYLDVIKDRLYVEKTDSATRRAAQTVIYRILEALTLLISPILAFTSDEIWRSMKHTSKVNPDRAVYNDMPVVSEISCDEGFMETWDKIHALRDNVQKALEEARNAKVIGASLEAKVTLFAKGDTFEFLSGVKDKLADVFIVSAVELKNEGEGAFKGSFEGVSVTVEKAGGHKCERCWKYTEDIGSDPNHPDICARCAKVVSE